MTITPSNYIWNYEISGIWLELLQYFNYLIRSELKDNVLEILATKTEDELIYETNVALVLKKNAPEIRKKIINLKFVAEDHFSSQHTIALAFFSKNSQEDIQNFKKYLSPAPEQIIASEWQSGCQLLIKWLLKTFKTKMSSIHFAERDDELYKGSNFLIHLKEANNATKRIIIEKGMMISTIGKDRFSFAINFFSKEASDFTKQIPTHWKSRIIDQ